MNGKRIKIGLKLIIPYCCLYIIPPGYANPSNLAFSSKDKTNVVQILHHRSVAKVSPLVQIHTPAIAENQQVVPINVQTQLTDVEMISIIADDNPFPLVAFFEFDKLDQASVSTRLKLSNTSNITVIVQAAGELYSANTQIKVTHSSPCG